MPVEECRKILRIALEKLERQEKNIIKLYFGFNKKVISKEEVAEHFDLELEELANLIKVILVKLKKHVQAELRFVMENEKGLEDYFCD